MTQGRKTPAKAGLPAKSYAQTNFWEPVLDMTEELDVGEEYGSVQILLTVG